MALVEETLFGCVDKVQKAIDRLKAFEPPDGYWLAFSAGKDSQCVYHLCQMAGVKFEAHYSVTSVDPPELMTFCKEHYPDVIWDRHFWNDGKPEHYFPDGRPKPITMWSLIADHTIPPTRQARYCCAVLKETGGKGRLVVTGVRWAESARRKALHGVADIQTESKKLHAQAQDNPAYKTNKNGGIVFMDDNDESRQMVEQCYAKRKTTINPIVDWEDEDVWEFLNDVAKVHHCCLYDEGFTRLGCIGCPLQGKDGMLRDFERWPKYKELYIKAFDRMIANHPGEIRVATGELAMPNVGGTCAERGSIGAPDVKDDIDNQSTDITGIMDGSQSVNVERERERIGRGSDISISGSTSTEQTRPTAAMVADGNSGGKLHVLDIELLSGEAADTHTHTSMGKNQGSHISAREKRCSKYGSKCTDNGRRLSELLAVALPERPDGHELASIEAIRPERATLRRLFNPDPRIADYESGESLLEEWVTFWNGG